MFLKSLRKIMRAYKEKRVFSALANRIKSLIRESRWIINDPASGIVSLHCPEYIKPSDGDRDDLKIAQRIFESFKKMKEDQRKAPGFSLYMPSSFWEGHLSKAYSHLNSALRSNDIDIFRFFLANFGTWKIYHAIESTTLIRDNMSSFLKRRYLKNDIFYKQLKVWKRVYNNRKPISCLSYPTYGNQAGAYIDDVFVGVGSFGSEIDGSILSSVISDVERPVVADLGAGYGKLAYFILRNLNQFTFIDFDLPETLCLAAYYLMKVWPGKKVLLYGEGEYSSSSHTKYDLIFMPCFEIQKIGERCVDLFINKNSLGEMNRSAVNNYIKYIMQATRYFFHLNHDVYRNVYTDNEEGLLGYEYPIPADRFKLLFRYPMFSLGDFEFNNDIFMYLYERIEPKSGTRAL